MTFQIRLVDVCIRIESIYAAVYDVCCGFLDESSRPEVCIAIRPFEVEQEAWKNGYIAPYPDEKLAQLEALVVYRKIALALLERHVLLMHGAVLSVGGKGVMFTAPSGTGKTTHCRLWMEHIPDCHMVNGDKPLIRLTDGVEAFGTPWCGKEHMGCNESVPLKAICILQRGQDNRMAGITTDQAWKMLLKQIYLPQKPEKMESTVQLFNKLCQGTAIYLLHCNMEPEAAKLAFETLKADGVIG